MQLCRLCSRLTLPRLLLANIKIEVKTSRYIASNKKSDDDEAESRLRGFITQKIHLLGLRSNQPRQALAIFDDFVHRKKKKPDLKMIIITLNCALVAKDLAKGKEIHQYIENNFPEWRDDLQLKQHLRHFYIKSNDPKSADQLFPQTKSTTNQSETKANGHDP